MDIAKNLDCADEYIELDRQNPDAQWAQLKKDNPYGFDVVVEATRRARQNEQLWAQRFTTSKLSTFSDLSKIATYGFRGALFARRSRPCRMWLSVITKTKSETCAWKTHYLDGVLVKGKLGQTAEPKPCAGNDGTTIIIEDLFYNPDAFGGVTKRAHVLDVMTKYAAHNSNVSSVCKRVGSSTPDLSTLSSSETNQAIHLLPSTHEVWPQVIEMDEHTESWSQAAEAHFTNPNYQSKKMIFLLFIDHRLVESPRIKRALENVYNSILPKGASPSVYLRYFCESTLDVNVHPTKKEVHFLNEESITDQILNRLQRALAAQSQSRVFEYQTLLTGGIADPDVSLSKKRKGKEPARDEDHRKKTASQYKVRTSLQDRTLDSMFPVLNPTQIQNGESSSASSTPRPPREIKESVCILSSVKTLRQAVAKGKHKQLSEILEKHTFVGIVDLHKGLSLMQHATKLYLVDHGAIAEELFYQLGLRQFGNFNRLKLQPPPPLRKLMVIAVELEETTEESGLTKREIVERIAETLISRRDMLSQRKIESLPAFLMCLGPQVDWTSEKECFETFLRELAYFYVPGPLCAEDPAAATEEDEETQDKAERWQIQHIVFPALRRYFVAPKTLLDGDVVRIASLLYLYKVFERC
ncbi:DNA mismatch repair protein MutL [Mycena amicta]|nr:DNA mismatch repair protein MutL [Mycena amicta]